jgi:hypothetical protein
MKIQITQKVGIVFILIISFITINLVNIETVFSASVNEQANVDIFLPLIKNGSRPQTVFGMEVINPSSSSIMQKAEDSGTYWVRYNAFNWADIEPTRTNPPTYNWNAVNETALRNIPASDLRTIGLILKTPSWAQKIPGKACGPIAEEDLPAFSQFVDALVRRYAYSGFNVKYWEFFNEQDAAWSIFVDGDSGYGCWGDSSDLEYYGGDYYAEMLKVAYPAVKAVDPNAHVVLGGLLLDCDPEHPPQGETCPSGNFLKGILSNGGGNYFDIANFHTYPYEFKGKIVDEIHYKWKHRGGILEGKAAFVKEVMANYGFSKPIFNGETAFNCPEWSDCNSNLGRFYENQASYVPRLFSISRSIGLLGSIWYELEGPGWRYCGLLNAGGSPKPAYIAYQFMTQEMHNTTALGKSSDYTSITTHKFSSATKQIWIMWSTNQVDVSVTLPSNTTKVLDKYGNEIPFTNPITINDPVYVELPK